MQIYELIDRLSVLCQHSSDFAMSESELLRLAFLISLRVDDLNELDDDSLDYHFRNVVTDLQAATEQHAAISDELDQLASTQPCEFSPDHVWTLVRAIKVQSRFLQMYLGKQNEVSSC